MSTFKTYCLQNQKLDYLEIHRGKDLPTIVLLHGYGANMKDLAPLASLSPSFKKYNWLFPNGTSKAPLGPMTYGNSWFPLGAEELEALIKRGESENSSSETSLDKSIFHKMKESSPLLKSFIDETIEGPFILGGFSQGSMIAWDLTFHRSLSPKALLLFSSTLVAKEKLEKRLKEKDFSPLYLFQSHGLEDPILPLSMARELKNIIQAHGIKVDYHEFPGGHEIPPSILQSLINFLEKWPS